MDGLQGGEATKNMATSTRFWMDPMGKVAEGGLRWLLAFGWPPGKVRNKNDSKWHTIMDGPQGGEATKNMATGTRFWMDPMGNAAGGGLRGLLAFWVAPRVSAQQK